MRIRVATAPRWLLLASTLALVSCDAGGRANDGCSVVTNADGSNTITCADGTRAVLRAIREGSSCIAAQGSLGEVRILCDNGTELAIPAGRVGSNGKDSSACTVHSLEQGVAKIVCGDGTQATIRDGAKGQAGQPGSSCTLTVGPQGESVISCADATSVVVRGGPLAPDPRRRHVILIIGDGMQLAHEIATSRYLYGKDDGLSFHHFPVRSFVTTWNITSYDKYATEQSLAPYSPYAYDPSVGYDPTRGGVAPYPLVPTPSDSYFLTPLDGKEPATDSASAATAMSTGRKTDDGNLAWMPDDPPDGALVTIAERLRAERGLAIGVVSTAPFSHATPAGFVSHNVARGNYLAIAKEIAEVVKPDVVIGGGHPNWSSTAFADAAILDGLRTSTEYLLTERQATVDGGTAIVAAAKEALSKHKKLFGVFGGADGSFEHQVPTNTPGSPSVARGNLENPTLAAAAEAALTVLSADPDGFFVMIEQGDIDWANHANNYRDMLGSVADLDAAVARVIEFVDRPGDAVDWSNTLVLVTADHANSFLRFGPTPLAAGTLPAQDCSAGCQYPGGEIIYGTGNHTNELVTLYARGAGAEAIHAYETVYPGRSIVDNTDIFHVMMTAARD